MHGVFETQRFRLAFKLFEFVIVLHLGRGTDRGTAWAEGLNLACFLEPKFSLGGATQVRRGTPACTVSGRLFFSWTSTSLHDLSFAGNALTSGSESWRRSAHCAWLLIGKLEASSGPEEVASALAARRLVAGVTEGAAAASNTSSRHPCRVSNT